MTVLISHPALRAPLKRGIASLRYQHPPYEIASFVAMTIFVKPPRPMGTPQEGNSFIQILASLEITSFVAMTVCATTPPYGHPSRGE